MSDKPAYRSAEKNAIVQIISNHLLGRMRDLHLDLHPVALSRDRLHSATLIPMTGGLLRFSRSSNQAAVVERLMGRDMAGGRVSVDYDRHPNIEVRATDEGWVIECILNRMAWWDQRNLVGKLSIARHRLALRALVEDAPGDLYVGFWDHLDRSDMALTAAELRRGQLFEEWISTFADGHDCLRIGITLASEADPVKCLVESLPILYRFYRFTAWTSDNDFQAVYEKLEARYRSADNSVV